MAEASVRKLSPGMQPLPLNPPPVPLLPIPPSPHAQEVERARPRPSHPCTSCHHHELLCPLVTSERGTQEAIYLLGLVGSRWVDWPTTAITHPRLL